MQRTPHSPAATSHRENPAASSTSGLGRDDGDDDEGNDRADWEMRRKNRRIIILRERERAEREKWLRERAASGCERERERESCERETES